jgi:hypothetical protein
MTMTASDENIKTSKTEKKEDKSTMERESYLTVEFLDCLEKAAQDIDPKTAEVKWEYKPFGDPYSATPNNDATVVRQYFARSPRSATWVSWDDLPVETEIDLWKRHKQIDTALDEPTACWAAFLHSRFYRKDQDTPGVNANHVRYIRLRGFGKLEGE